MDSLSQVMLGAALAEVTVGRKIGRAALVIGGALGTLPDMDVLVHYPDAVASFTYHRSWSHSLFTLSLLSIPLAWILHRLYRHRFSKANSPSNPKTPPSFQQWLACTWLVLFTHPILDGFTIYGTQLLWPIPTTPIAWGSVFIIDPLYTAPLIMAFIVAWRQRTHAFKAASLALAISTAYIGVSLISQQHARTVAFKSLTEQSLNTSNVLIAPAPFSVLWRVVAMDGERYHEGFYSVFDNDHNLTFDTYPSHRGVIESQYSKWSVARLDWFTRGFISANPTDNRLFIRDLRMGMESSYVFRFDVGALDDPNSDTLSTSLPLRLNMQRMKALIRRVMDESVAIPLDG